jgi:hypothetical protein
MSASSDLLDAVTQANAGDGETDIEITNAEKEITSHDKFPSRQVEWGCARVVSPPFATKSVQ